MRYRGTNTSQRIIWNDWKETSVNNSLSFMGRTDDEALDDHNNDGKTRQYLNS